MSNRNCIRSDPAATVVVAVMLVAYPLSWRAYPALGAPPWAGLSERHRDFCRNGRAGRRGSVERDVSWGSLYRTARQRGVAQLIAGFGQRKSRGRKTSTGRRSSLRLTPL